MMAWGETSTALHVAAAATGTASLVTTVTQPMIPGLGVAVSVLLAANAGALVGLAYAAPGRWSVFKPPAVEGRTRRAVTLATRALALGFTLEALAITSAWAVTIAPHVPMLDWTSALPPMPTAGLLAAGGQYLFPAAIAAGKRFFDSKWGARS